MERSTDLSSHGIVALVRDDEGKFLLLEDAREQMQGYWAPPHGRCEAGDIDEATGVVREVKEETGLDVVPVRPILTQPADTKVKTVSFWLVDGGDKGEVILDHESSSFGWFSVVDALKLRLYPGTRTLFEQIERGDLGV